MSGKCNAFLLADRVIREDNGKIGVIGSFNIYNVSQYPVQIPAFFTYANIEGITGKMSFALNIANDITNFVVFSNGGELDIPPEQIDGIDLVIPVPPLTFPQEGVYNVVMNINGIPLGSRRLLFKKIN